METTTKAVCAKHNISVGKFYAWKRKYGGMELEEAREVSRLFRTFLDFSA